MDKELILITDPLERKSFDLYNLIRRDFPEENMVLVTTRKKTILLELMLKLIYPKCIKLIGEKYTSYESISECFINSKIIFLPIQEESIIRFLEELESKEFLSKKFKFRLPNKENFNLSRNKKDLSIWCAEHKIDCPKTYSIEDLKNNNYTLPLIVKPIHGSGSRGIIHLHSRKDLNKILESKEKYLIQEKLKNSINVEGCFILADNGKIISAYTHQRLRTYPKNGGVTVLSKLTRNEELISISQNVVKDLAFNGLLMIEYLWDTKTKSYKLIEINPRIWGSILLSELSGFKLVSQYINLCSKPISEKLTITHKPYYIRWLLPYDLNYIFKITKGKTAYINITYARLISSLVIHLILYPYKFLSRI